MDFSKISDVLTQVADAIEQGMVRSEANHKRAMETMAQTLVFVDDLNEFISERSEAPRQRAGSRSSAQEMLDYLLRNENGPVAETVNKYKEVFLTNQPLLKKFYDTVVNENFKASWEGSTDEVNKNKDETA